MIVYFMLPPTSSTTVVKKVGKNNENVFSISDPEDLFKQEYSYDIELGVPKDEVMQMAKEYKEKFIDVKEPTYTKHPQYNINISDIGRKQISDEMKNISSSKTKITDEPLLMSLMKQNK